MSKKILIAIIIALVVVSLTGLWVSGSALAQDEHSLIRRIRRARPTIGQVKAITEDGFSIEKRDGEKQDFLVDETTRFFDRDKNELTFDDLLVDQWIAVIAPKDVTEPVARFVIILPEGFDPSHMSIVRGTIIELDLTRQSLTLQDRQGEEVSLLTDEETFFRGMAEDLDDLQEGMLASAIIQETDDGTFLGRLVRSRYPMARALGEIIDVDEDASTFILQSRRDGEEHTITVEEGTRFRGKDGSVQSLADLQMGMVSIVIARRIPSDSGELWNAVWVAATEPDDLPQYDLKLIGKVISVDSDTFTVQGRDGQEYTFEVVDDSRFRGRRIPLGGLSDLQDGMWVFVGATDLGDGAYQADMVMILRRGG